MVTEQMIDIIVGRIKRSMKELNKHVGDLESLSKICSIENSDCWKNKIGIIENTDKEEELKDAYIKRAKELEEEDNKKEDWEDEEEDDEDENWEDEEDEDEDWEYGIRNSSRVLNEEHVPTEKLKISSERNDTIKKIDIDELQENSSFDKFLGRWTSKINTNKDGVLTFSTENPEEDFTEEWKGCRYRVLRTTDDEGFFYYVFIYFDGTEFKYYIPIRGNSINNLRMERVSTCESDFDDHKAWFKKEGFNVKKLYDNLYNFDLYKFVDYIECRKEFESILELA